MSQRKRFIGRHDFSTFRAVKCSGRNADQDFGRTWPLCATARWSSCATRARSFPASSGTQHRRHVASGWRRALDSGRCARGVGGEGPCRRRSDRAGLGAMPDVGALSGNQRLNSRDDLAGQHIQHQVEDHDAERRSKPHLKGRLLARKMNIEKDNTSVNQVTTRNARAGMTCTSASSASVTSGMSIASCSQL